VTRFKPVAVKGAKPSNLDDSSAVFVKGTYKAVTSAVPKQLFYAAVSTVDTPKSKDAKDAVYGYCEFKAGFKYDSIFYISLFSKTR
jgi:hypothetical protein